MSRTVILIALAACACSAPGAPSVTRLDPGPIDGVVYVQRSLEIEYAVAGAADEVRVRIDGREAVLAAGGHGVLSVADVPEGPHELALVARRGVRSRESAPMRLVVDRTPPTFLGWDPDPASLVSAPPVVWARFSEPIAMAALPFEAFGDAAPVRAVAEGARVRFSADAGNVTSVRIPSFADPAQNRTYAALSWSAAAVPHLPPTEIAFEQPEVLAAFLARIPLAVTGPAPREIVLSTRADGREIGRLGGPPWIFEWDVASVPEGRYAVAARGVTAGGSTIATRNADAIVVVDRTPGAVLSIRAERDAFGAATAIDRDEALVVTFSEAVDAARAVDASLVQVLSGGVPVAATRTLERAGTRLEVRIDEVPASGTGVLAISGQRDAAGNPIADTSVAFTIPEWRRFTWSYPACGSGRPAVRIGPQGSVAAAPAFQWAGSMFAILQTSYGFTPVPTLPGSACSVVSGAALAYGSGLAAIWTEGARVRGEDRNVSIEVPVSPGVTAVRAPAATFDADLLTVAFTEVSAGGATIAVATRSSDGAWVSIPPGVDGSEPSIAGRRGGGLLLAYVDGAGQTRVAARGGSWSGLGGPLGPACPGVAPSVTDEASGAPLVAFCEATLGGTVRVLRWNGTAWAALSGSAEAEPGPGRAPAIAVAPDGTAWLADLEDVAGVARVRLRRWTGARWERVAGSLNHDPAVAAGAPDLSIAPDGRPAIAWVEGGSIRWRWWNR